MCTAINLLLVPFDKLEAPILYAALMLNAERIKAVVGHEEVMEEVLDMMCASTKTIAIYGKAGDGHFEQIQM